MGIIAVLFAVAAAYANAVFHDLLAVSPYLPLIVSPLGLALVVAITRKYFPGSQGSGIPQTIAALKISDPEARESVLSLKIAIGKMFMTLLALFSGASAGREARRCRSAHRSCMPWANGDSSPGSMPSAV